MKPKKMNSIKDLAIGSLVREINKGDSICVTHISDSFAVGVDHRHISNPCEWKMKDGGILDSLKRLHRGSVIQSRINDLEFVIMGNYGDFCIGTRSEVITDDGDFLVYPNL
jgi:hypothetical protein